MIKLTHLLFSLRIIARNDNFYTLMNEEYDDLPFCVGFLGGIGFGFVFTLSLSLSPLILVYQF